MFIRQSWSRQWGKGLRALGAVALDREEWGVQILDVNK